MKLGQLKEIDKTFQIIRGNADVNVLGICDHYSLRSNYFLFIKNNKFLNEWLDKKNLEIKTGLVFEKKFFETLSIDQKKIIEDQSTFTATVDDVNLSMSYLSKIYYQDRFKNINDVVDGRQMGSASIDSSAFIAQGVFIGENVMIHADVKIHSGTVIMSGVEIGEGSEIYPNVSIYRNVKIGKNVRIHSQCSIGADGFGYNFFQGEHVKVWHMGSVVIGDNVEIGANSCVDGGTFSPTTIAAGCKIDNLVQVGHNCKLGVGVLLCGQSGLAGSCILGDYVVLGGRAAVGPGVTVGKAAQIAGNAGVISDVEAGETVGGFPARNIKEWMKGVALVRKLSLNK